jgi:hypothetical protein
MEAAQTELVRLKILSKEDRPILEAAPIGYVDMMILRMFRALEKACRTDSANWGSP